MRSRWTRDGADGAISRWAARWDPDVALRVYTSRLLGAEPTLVLHGGGNTSLKGVWTDLLGREVPALYVKGSGWDLATIEPEGLPAVDLERMRELRQLTALSDSDMVNALRAARFDASAPSPSVETLLHAFLPHTYVDHSHAEAILALSNCAGGTGLIRQVLGARVAIVPYVMPGFELARVAADIADGHPDVEGLVLEKHGLFTFGATAEESYRRHVDIVNRAEEWLGVRTAAATWLPGARTPLNVAKRRAGSMAPLLRGVLAEHGESGAWKRWVLDHRATIPILEYTDSADVGTLAQSGPLTPDHVIRTKPWPVVVGVPDPDDEGTSREAIEDAIGAFREAYRAYFDRHAAGRDLQRLDDTPRVVLVKGVGLFGVGRDARAARIAADLYERTILVKLGAAPAVGDFVGLSEGQLFEMEYWSLEQMKLGQGGANAPFAGRIAVVTGAAGAIGFGVMRQLLAQGAHVVGLDKNAAALESVGEKLRPRDRVALVRCDVTEAGAVEEAFESASRCFGGVDVVVVCAGAAAVATLEDTDEETFARLVDVNLVGVWRTLASAAGVMRRQGTGGDVVLVSSKTVLAPGAGFGAYSATKAGAHQLARVAALELAPLGVRVNMVTPDAVFEEGDVRSGLWREVGAARAASRGIDPGSLEAHYRDRNLLRSRITGSDVGRAVAFLASGATPTTGAVLPVDGGIPSAFPR